MYVDLTRDPPAFYTAENISLAGISEPHRDELLRIANMTETERLEYLDRTLNGVAESERQTVRSDWSTDYEWSRSSGIGGGDWPTSLMHSYSEGGNATTGYAFSSPSGDGPVEAYARDEDGAPASFTWVSCAAGGDPRRQPGGNGYARMKVQTTVSLECKKSGDAQAGSNWGYYMKVYDGSTLVAYQSIRTYAKETDYLGSPYAYSSEYNYGPDNKFQPEALTRNWVENYGNSTGSFWSICERDVEPSGDYWYHYLYAQLYTRDPW